MRSYRRLFAYLVTGSLVVGIVAAVALPLRAAPAPSLYWGALISGSTYGTDPATGKPYGNPPWDLDTWSLFEAHAGKQASILHWALPWYASQQWPNGYEPFPTSLMTTIRNRGAIPLLDWGSWDLSANGALSQPNYSLGAIISGKHDAYIRQWAAAAKAWGFPFFLRFDWEMNGNWFPWSEQVNGNQPGQFVAAWRHVHDLFTAAGANNVTWVWAPNIASPALPALSEYYPGASYVDWTGLDGYNKYNVWLSFNSVFTASGITWLYDSYQQVLALAPSKPMMLAEFASLEAGDGGAKKAAWIRDALTTQIPANFPAIKAIVWFDWNSDPGSSYAIESSALSQSAFAAGIASSLYAANVFGSLPAGGKVQPLSPPATASPSPATPASASTQTPTKTSTAGPTRTNTPAATKTSTPRPSATHPPTPTPTQKGKGHKR